MPEQPHAQGAGTATPMLGRLAEPATPFFAADKGLAGQLHAELVRHGHAVHEQADSAFVIFCWDLTQYCADIGELVRLARQVGALHG